MQVTFDDRETTHRVICGSAFYESMGLEPETIIERVFAFLLAKKIPRRTEGCYSQIMTPASSMRGSILPLTSRLV